MNELSNYKKDTNILNPKGLIIENRCGLINTEGVCYFNAVIQSLFCNKNFVLFYIMNDFREQQMLSKIIQNLAYRMITQRVVDPVPFIIDLHDHPRLINNCTVNGGNPLVLVEELLIGLFSEIVDEENLKFTEGSPENFFLKETHSTTCDKCKNTNEETIHDVSMKIPFSNTIEESLKFYKNIKLTEVKNRYYKCKTCKMFTPVVRQSMKSKLEYPENLMVVFERVSVKNNVIYSIFQEIDFNKQMSIGGKKYEAYAAICSYMLSKGYHANAIAYKNGRWILFNDSQLEVFPPDYFDDEIFNNYAWIIFYRKIE